MRLNKNIMENLASNIRKSIRLHALDSYLILIE